MDTMIQRGELKFKIQEFYEHSFYYVHKLI